LIAYFFYKRDAILARCVCICASVCPSVTQRYCFKTATRFELVFGKQDSLEYTTYPTLRFKDIRVSPNSIFLCNFSQILDLEKFRYGLSSVVNSGPTTASSLSHDHSAWCTAWRVIGHDDTRRAGPSALSFFTT